eukprot:8555441-Ditylum_brightwellii.AAC.1
MSQGHENENSAFRFEGRSQQRNQLGEKTRTKRCAKGNLEGDVVVRTVSRNNLHDRCYEQPPNHKMMELTP